MSVGASSTLTQLEEDFKELQLEARSLGAVKSQEEIEKLTVDEQLRGIDRAVYLLSSGQEVQQISVINQLPDLLRDNNADCMRRVVPKVREVLHLAQAEMQLAASSAFLQILQKELVPVQNYTQTFLQTILMSVDSRDPDVAGAWLDTLLDVIDLLPKDVIKKDVLAIAVAKGQLSQSVQSRLACCKILGKIATKFDPFVIKKEILPVVQSLCQDVDYEVRGCMCRQLDPVARGLGLEATKSAILPELVELTNDEESHVRLAGLETVVNMISLLDDDTCTNTIVPLVCKFCQQAMESGDSTLPVVAKQLGKLCHGLSANLTQDQRTWLIDFYKKLCKLGQQKKSNKEDNSPTTKVPVSSAKTPVTSPTKASVSASTKTVSSPTKVSVPQPPRAPVSSPPPPKPAVPLYEQLSITELFKQDSHEECRQNAAFNFPALVLFGNPKSFKSQLYPAFTALCTDPSVNVRKSVAAGFHEVAKLLGPDVASVQNDFITLLNDDSIDVLKGLVPTIPEVLGLFAQAGVSQQEGKQTPVPLTDVIPALIACDCVVTASNNWRLQADLMDQLSCLHKIFTSEQIHQKFIPLLFKKLSSARALPVRHAAARTLLILIRYNHRLEQRQDMCFRIIEDFCHGRSCHQRFLFIDVCKIVMELFSKTFFKEYFFEFLLALASDPVANVRLRLCRILPALKGLLKLPTDRNLLQQLDSSVRMILINEKDRDVEDAIRLSVEELDKTQVQMESVMRRSYFDEDIVDRRKEKEELELIELEEKERKEEEAKMAKDKKKDKKDGTSRIPAPKRQTKIPTASKEKIGSGNQAARKGATASSNTSVKSAGSSVGVSNKSSKTASSTAQSKGANSSVTGSPRLGQRPVPNGATKDRRASGPPAPGTTAARTSRTTGTSSPQVNNMTRDSATKKLPNRAKPSSTKS
ncbi:serine/threonine-protein phosphatase 4 regulatory subunit 4-like isoform X2 [Lineus longissimus]|uniref:serine/threonine-protein phosphatase 4 regulatory subunit 4-like isoform X2 n=1 Tax=Lineus longissimus TaxID=88925 RepID=UPI00315CBD89